MNEEGRVVDRLDTLDFLKGGGDLGTLMRAHDWTATPFGPAEGWPQSLRSAVSIMLNSRYPIALYWGTELALLYNDAWSPILGNKHPWALGRPGRDVWPEIWNTIGPLYEQVLTTGEGVWQEDELLPMRRHGYLEECYFNFTFSPVRGVDGGIDGIFNAVVETTDKVLSERRLRILSRMGERADADLSIDAACRRVSGLLAENRKDTPFALVYLCENGNARLAAAAGIDPGSAAAPKAIRLRSAKGYWPLGKAEAAGHTLVIPGSGGINLPSGDWPEPVTEVAILPVVTPGDVKPTAFLVAAANPRRRIDENYRSFFELAAGHISTAIGTARAYEEERKRAESLAKIDRAKTIFFSNVSHEFRTPLTLMLGPLEEVLAQPEGGVTPENRALVDVAHRNGLRLMRLVNALLDFSRIESGRVEATYAPTDLATFTSEIASSFRSLIEKAGIVFNVSARALSGPVFIDREMWEKIVLNLLSNAFKFTFEGEIGIALEETGDRATLSVSDTGTGIPADALPHLFERFQRVEGAKGRSFEGSGIGLALVKELVELHGGNVWVESEEGRGTCFRVAVPLGSDHLPVDRVAESAEAEAGAFTEAFVEEAARWLPDGSDLVGGGSQQAREHIGQSERIVLADDNADMRSYLRRLLVGQGYEVEDVGDGEAALAAIRRKRPTLVLTDVMMPRIDGFGLLRELRRDTDLATVPVIMLSARAGEEAQVEGLEAGADDYLVKPFSARELVAKVDSAIEISRARQVAEDALRELNARLAGERETLSRLVEQAPALMFMLSGPELRFEFANDSYLELVGHRKLIGKPVREVFPELEGQGYFALLDQVFRTGKPYRQTGAPVSFARTAGGPVEDMIIDFVFQPVKDVEENVAGILVQGTDVTERTRAEAALRESEERFRQIADSAPAHVWTTDDQGKVTFANRWYYETLGRPAEEVLNDGWRAIMHPDDVEGAWAAFSEAVTERSVFSRELRVIDKTNAVRILDCKGVPQFDRQGRLLGYTGINIDITDRKRAERALADSEERFRNLVSASNPVLYSHSADWSAMKQLAGGGFLADTDKPDFDWFDKYIHPDDQPHVWAKIQEAIAHKTVFELEHRVIQEDGSLGWTSSRSIPVLDERGEIAEWFGAASDVTERRNAAERLAQESRRLEILNRSGAALAAELDLESIVQMVTDAGVELTGAEFGAFFYNVVDKAGESYLLYSLSGAPRSAFENFPMPRNTAVFAPTFEGTGTVRSDDITKDPRYGKNRPRNGMPEGHLPVCSYLAVPVISRSGEVIGGLFFGHSEPTRFTEAHEHLMMGIASQAAVSIDNARLYETLQSVNAELEQRVEQRTAELESANEALRQAQKMEAIGQLTGGIAHDFNNMLTVIQGSADMLQRDSLDGPKRRRYAAAIMETSERAARLTGQLLAFARRQSLKPQVFEVGERVEFMADMLQTAIGSLVTLVIEAGCEGCFVEADSGQFESALVNMAVNSRDAMDGEGTLTIRIERATALPSPAKSDDGGFVAISVSDTGEGIAREALDRIFEPFFTTKEVGKGTGLGLSQVYGFAKQSGGEIAVNSKLGEGATFTLYLPETLEPATVVSGTDPQPAPATGEGKVLVVEDNAAVGEFAQQVLADLGFEATLAVDAREAEALLDQGEDFDLVFTDVVMPGISGVEFAARLKKKRPGLPVVLTSGYSQILASESGHGFPLLQKPYSVQELARVLDEVLSA